MDFESLLKGLRCTCGREHTCSIDKVIIKEGAVKEIAELSKEYKSIVIAADVNTYPLCGDRIVSLLSDKKVKTVIFEECPLVPNEEAIDGLTSALEPDTDLIIGIGSGVIQDLCKYVSFYNKLPYYIVATAPSMDGYASVGAAMITGGMKVTYNAHTPKAIICDVDIIKDAPMDMIQAGYGDILGKFSCLNDWKLSHIVNGEYYCEYVANLTYEMLNKTKDLGEKLRMRDPEAIKTLTEALIGVGIAMAYVGNSRPASGSEHHMAHYFEIVGLTKNEPYFMHGIDVVFSTVYTQRLREAILKMDKPIGFSGHDHEKWQSEIERIYSSSAEGVIALQSKLGWYGKERLSRYAEKWDEIRAVLSETPSSERLIEYIESVGLDISVFEREYGKEKISDATLYAKDLKDRYSVLWMYYDLVNQKIAFDVNDIKLYLFDMDGTLYLGDRLYSFTKELLETIKKQGKRYLFMTNNSSKSVYDYIKKLKKLGIEAEYDDFITSSQATALYLKDTCPSARLYVCGTESLKEELRQNGFTVTEEREEADCIVMGNDTELTFKKLDDVSYLLSTRDIRYIATNPDYVCPTEYGSVPDCGSVCDMIFNATGKSPIFIGKPEPAMPRIAMKMTGYRPHETAVVGDRIYTDIKSGINAGCRTILVMSGETTYQILEGSADKPDIVLTSGEEILEGIK